MCVNPGVGKSAAGQDGLFWQKESHNEEALRLMRVRLLFGGGRGWNFSSGTQCRCYRVLACSFSGMN